MPRNYEPDLFSSVGVARLVGQHAMGLSLETSLKAYVITICKTGARRSIGVDLRACTIGSMN
jgi:hypothetical protein